MKKEIIKDWNFDEFEIVTEGYTNWDMYEKLKDYTDANSKVLDLGCGGRRKNIKILSNLLKRSTRN